MRRFISPLSSSEDNLDERINNDDATDLSCNSLNQRQDATLPSVRVLQEQMELLRRDIFDLKQRLSHPNVEESSFQQSIVNEQDTLTEHLRETRGEIENLRKEIDAVLETAQDVTQMGKNQLEIENKNRVAIEELKERVQKLENECIGWNARSELLVNLNAFEKIEELEAIVRHSKKQITDLTTEKCVLENLLAERDKENKGLEEKVKNLTSQNANLVEAFEANEEQIGNAEGVINEMRLKYHSLKKDHQHLIGELKVTQDHYNKEISNIKTKEKQIREQQVALHKMQSTICVKSSSTTHLVERIKDYENIVMRVSFERAVADSEIQYLKALIHKLQPKPHEYLTKEDEEAYQRIVTEAEEKSIDHNERRSGSSGIGRSARNEEYETMEEDEPNNCAMGDDNLYTGASTSQRTSRSSFPANPSISSNRKIFPDEQN